jgi:hypothetical protein
MATTYDDLPKEESESRGVMDMALEQAGNVKDTLVEWCRQALEALGIGQDSDGE